MGYTILHLLDWLLWIIMAASTLYTLFFALASLLPRRRRQSQTAASPQQYTFLILFPAYKEDAVIIQSVESVIKQDYPSDHYRIAVISDHMEEATNQQLAALPLTLLKPSFEKSSKAKALQFAMLEMSRLVPKPSDYVVILDADNVVNADFLKRLNIVCNEGHLAIQCHRTAKNSNNGVAVLDGVSEEINNSLFRKGHSRLGLSAGLIGSGMCFSYDWFRQNVGLLNSAVEDRELEALLLQQGIHIHYAEDIDVMDEKVSSSDNFQRQRQRWITGQVQSFLLMLPHLPKALLTGNINYADKAIQQALIPRSMLLLFTFPIALLLALLLFGTDVRCSAIRWWLLFAAQCLAIFIAIPSRLRLAALRQALLVPRLAWLMVRNLLQVNVKDKDFLHTTHGNNQ